MTIELRKYCWETKTEDIRNWIDSCEHCRNEEIKKRFRAPGTLIEAPSDINEIWYIDHAQPKKYLYLFVIEALSRYVKVIILNSFDETTDALKNLFCEWGTPKKIISDNGSTFHSKSFQKLLEQYGVSHYPVTPLHPQSNGICERVIGTLKNKVTRALENNRSHIPTVMSYNNTIHPSTGFSPYELFYARAPREMITGSLLRDIIEGRFHKANRDKITAKVKIDKSKQRNKKLVDSRQALKFKPELQQQVMFKLGNEYQGPETILTINRNTNTTQILYNNALFRRHFNQLKPLPDVFISDEGTLSATQHIH
ncbi:uncharacterized protein K02A2.6-like [Phymastichus coffea]|uniref:uncharacterized protein K02A2.6-like n=1 Tax=Phymastichus coffea TaxID=108790 RepID=UPI00273BDAB1|nr:uncharacterized protein K02A2.6-like [Phymastichus coffea]